MAVTQNRKLLIRRLHGAWQAGVRVQREAPGPCGATGGLAPSEDGDDNEAATKDKFICLTVLSGSLGRREGQGRPTEKACEGRLPPGLPAQHLSPAPHTEPGWMAQPVPRSSERPAQRQCPPPRSCVLPFRKNFSLWSLLPAVESSPQKSRRPSKTYD